MEFENHIEITGSEFQFTTRIDPSETSPLRKERKGKQSATAEIEADTNPDYLPVEFEIQPFDELAVSPLHIRLSEQSELLTPIPLDLYFSEESPINFSVSVFYSDEDISDISFEVYSPPYQVLEWGQNLLPSRRPVPEEARDPVETEYGSTTGETLSEVCSTLDSDRNGSAIRELITELQRWLPAWEVFYLIDQCKQSIEAYEDHSDKEGLTEFFTEILINQSGSPHFTFETWNEVIQFTHTTQKLSTIPSLRPEELIKSAFDDLLNDNTRRTDPVDLLWGLEQRFEVSTYLREELTEEEAAVLLAKSVTERDYVRAERIIKALDPVPVEEDLNTLFRKAKQASGEEKLRRSRNLILPALDSGRNEFLEAVKLYFESVITHRDYSLPSKAATNEAQVVIYRDLNSPNFARTARHYYNYYRGLRFLRVERYQESADHFRQAVTESLDEHATHGDIRFTQLSEPLIRYYQAVTKQLYEENRFSEAADRLGDEGIPILQQLDYFQVSENEGKKEYTKSRLQAMCLEAEGNRHLQLQEYQDAVRKFGQGVSKYHEAGRDHEAEFLDNRRRAIDAALSEQTGQFNEAANDHEVLAEKVNDDEFSTFHEARATICRTKQTILDWDFEQAQQNLSNINIDWGTVGGEIQYLQLLLNELETFECGSTSDITRVLDDLDGISLGADNDLHINYGHDYRPVFIYILAAQRLQQFDGMDDISNSLIEISLSDVLKPDQVNKVLERHGWSDIQLDQQWQERVPIFTLSQYHEVEKAEASKISTENYKDQGKTLTASLEQYLNFIAEYYGCLEYGEEWVTRISDSSKDPTLDPLARFLNNKAFDELPWIEIVRELLSRIAYDELTVASKDGDLVDVRNDLHHNSINHLSKEDYEEIKSDIEQIYQETALKIPILGKVLGQNEYGAYSVHLFIRRTKTQIEIKTDAEVELDSIYYFPPEVVMSSDPVPNVKADEIVRCRSHRVREGLADYSEKEI